MDDAVMGQRNEWHPLRRDGFRKDDSNNNSVVLSVEQLLIIGDLI